MNFNVTEQSSGKTLTYMTFYCMTFNLAKLPTGWLLTVYLIARDCSIRVSWIYVIGFQFITHSVSFTFFYFTARTFYDDYSNYRWVKFQFTSLSGLPSMPEN